MQTVLDDTDPFGMPEDVPMCDSVEEILKQLEPTQDGKTVGYFRFDPLKLADHPDLAEIVERLVESRCDEVNLFPVNGRGFAMGERILTQEDLRNDSVLMGISIEP